jgi:hypothetical protein
VAVDHCEAARPAALVLKLALSSRDRAIILAGGAINLWRETSGQGDEPRVEARSMLVPRNSG